MLSIAPSQQKGDIKYLPTVAEQVYWYEMGISGEKKARYTEDERYGDTKKTQSRFRFTKNAKLENTYKWVSVIVFSLSSSFSADLVSVITDLFLKSLVNEKKSKKLFQV